MSSATQMPGYWAQMPDYWAMEFLQLNDVAIDFRDRLEKAVEENTKLRELVADMWFWSYEGYIDSEPQEKQMEHIDGVLSRMRELGVDA